MEPYSTISAQRVCEIFILLVIIFLRPMTCFAIIIQKICRIEYFSHGIDVQGINTPTIELFKNSILGLKRKNSILGLNTRDFMGFPEKDSLSFRKFPSSFLRRRLTQQSGPTLRRSSLTAIGRRAQRRASDLTSATTAVA